MRIILLIILLLFSASVEARKKPPYPNMGGNQRPANGIWLSPTDTECTVRVWRICIIR